MINKSKSLLLRNDLLPSFFVLALCAYILFAHLGDLALIAPDEGRNAEVAREMSVNHAWLVPTYNGLTYLDKPAFYFKTIALSFSWFGKSEATARLSSASFAFLLLIEVFWFCRKVYDQRTATFAALVVATMPLYIIFARIVIFDMTLAFFVCTSIFACYIAEEQGQINRKQWYSLAAAAGAIATLVKGPVGFIIPTLVVTLFNTLEGRVNVMKQAFTWRNCLIFFAIVLPWFIGLSWQCPDFPYYGIMRESVARFTTTEFHRTAPFYFYAAVIAVSFFPWSLMLPESIYGAWQNRKRLSKPDRLFIVWALVVVVFFSISKSKLPGYILTVTVAFGILWARVFAKATDYSSKTTAIIRRSTLMLLLVCLLLSALTASIVFEPSLITDRLKPNKVWKFQFFLPHFKVLSLSFLGTVLLCAISLKFKNAKFAFATFMSIPILLLTVNFGLLTQYAESRSVRSLAESLTHDLPATTQLACIECLPQGLPFYSNQLITVFSKEGKEFTSNYVEFSLSSGKDWPEHIVPIAQLQDWLDKRKHPVYLLAKADRLAILNNIAQQHGLKVSTLDSDYSAILLP